MVGSRIAHHCVVAILAVLCSPAALHAEEQASNGELAVLKARAALCCATFSPDGKTLAAAGGSRDDGVVRLWNAANWQPKSEFDGHTAYVYCVSFSPDGKRIASASADKTVCLWDVESGKRIAVLQGHSARVNAVAFSPDGKTIASGGNGKVVMLSDAATGEQRHVLPQPSTIQSVEFSSDGRYLAVASDGVTLWNPTSGEAIATTADERAVWEIALSNDGNTIAAATGASVMLWDSATRKLKARKTVSGLPFGVDISPDGRWLAGGDTKLIRIWDMESLALQKTFKGHASVVTSVSFSPDGKNLASASWDKTVRIWPLSGVRID